MILGVFDIKYMPHTSVKGQVLTDLVAEFTEPPLEEVTKAQHMDGKSVDMISQQGPLSWKVYVDGAANQKGFGVGIVLISPEKITIEKSLRLDFTATNNEANYEALLMGMTMVQKMGEKAIEMFSDVRLVVGQVKGEFEARDERMQRYLSHTYGQDSNLSTCCTSLEVETPMLIPWPRLLPPWHKVFLKSSSWKICTNPQGWREKWYMFTKSG